MNIAYDFHVKVKDYQNLDDNRINIYKLVFISYIVFNWMHMFYGAYKLYQIYYDNIHFIYLHYNEYLHFCNHSCFYRLVFLDNKKSRTGTIQYELQ